MSDITLTLIGKPSCHLCEDAQKVVTEVVATFPAGAIAVEHLNIEEDKELFDAYWEQIPVLLVNGKVHNYWRIDPVRLSTALKELV